MIDLVELDHVRFAVGIDDVDGNHERQSIDIDGDAINLVRNIPGLAQAHTEPMMMRISADDAAIDVDQPILQQENHARILLMQCGKLPKYLG